MKEKGIGVGEKNGMYGKHCIVSKETREKLSKALLGNKHGIRHKHELENIQNKNNRKKSPEEIRQTRSNAQKGKNTWAKNRKYINNGKVIKMVKLEEIQEYLNQGFVFGRKIFIKEI